MASPPTPDRLVHPARLDLILIDGLVVTTTVGALPHEREIPQPIRVDLALHVDLSDAGSTDELDHTVHYGLVTDRVANAVREAKDTLLERLAERAADVALSFARVDAVDVTITKLRPPLAEAVETTAVRIHRDGRSTGVAGPVEHRAFVALGSNLGDRLGYLRSAVDGLGHVTAMSRVYETAPIGGPDQQGPYLNMVVEVATPLDPFAFLRRCQRLESAALRQRVEHWGPRTLDVDIIFFDEIEIRSPELVVPHPRFAERRFVLAPLADIAPDRCPADWDTTLPPDPVDPLGRLDELLTR